MTVRFDTNVMPGLPWSFHAEVPSVQVRTGETKTVWMEWSVNPTDVATRHETATLYDGKTPLTTVHRTVTIFP